MRLSLLISILLHVVLLWVLLTLFRIVPEMRLPDKIYQVKILQPIVRSRPPEPEQRSESETPVVEEEKPAEVKPKEKDQKPEQKQESKPQPEEEPMDVAIDKEAEDGTSIAVVGERFPFSYYLSAIERKVSQNWFSGVGGGGLSCVVYFRLSRDGRIADLRVEQTSGNSYFDRSATRAVRSAAPFPPLPRAFADEFLGIHFTFVQKD